MKLRHSIANPAKSFLTGLLMFIVLSNYAQHSGNFKKEWRSEVNSLKVFIENKAQFSDIDGRKILYAFIGDNEKYYFTENGLIIQLDTVLYKKSLVKKIKEIFKKEEDEGRENFIVKSYYLSAEWQNTSNESSMETSGQVEEYYTFRNSTSISHGYKKLTYKNIYPNIDIEYSIPSDSSGIKYNIILHPGADITDLQLQYSGDIVRMFADKYGNIIVRTPVHDITEHAPKSYYSALSGDVVSSYLLQDNTISFFASYPD
jgi:hypothetical protein